MWVSPIIILLCLFVQLLIAIIPFSLCYLSVEINIIFSAKGQLFCLYGLYKYILTLSHSLLS